MSSDLMTAIKHYREAQFYAVIVFFLFNFYSIFIKSFLSKVSCVLFYFV